MITFSKLTRSLLTLFLCSIIIACGGEDDSTDDSESACDVAVEASSEAFTEFDTATEENKQTACEAYKAALAAQISACGDDNGSLQSLIDNTDCTEGIGGDDMATGTLSVTAGTLPLDFDTIIATRNAGIVSIVGTTSAPENYSLSFQVDEGITGEDIDRNFQLSLTSTFTPYREGTSFDFQFELTVNNATQMQGTFSELVQKADGGQLSLTRGTIDLQFQQ